MMIRPSSPWGKKAAETLADFQWHSVPEVLSICYPYVSYTIASQKWINHLKEVSPNRDSSKDNDRMRAIVMSGRKVKIREVLKNWARTGVTESTVIADVEYVRFSDKLSLPSTMLVGTRVGSSV